MNHKRIPDWARWIAMDENGVWWCYEDEPQQFDRGWYENEVGRSQQVRIGGVEKQSWQNSLQNICQKKG